MVIWRKKMFKVGDGAIFIDDSDMYTDERLELGKGYVVSYVFGKLISVKGKEDVGFYHERFKRVEDNPVNRILYPEIDWGNNED
jgi:hypothetical protein